MLCQVVICVAKGSGAGTIHIGQGVKDGVKEKMKDSCEPAVVSLLKRRMNQKRTSHLLIAAL